MNYNNEFLDREYPARKPKMSEERRTILNLLEYILETQPQIDSVYNVFALYVSQVDEDHIWVNDSEWAQWFEEYVDKISPKKRETHDVDGT